jgi:hypothetical protein
MLTRCDDLSFVSCLIIYADTYGGRSLLRDRLFLKKIYVYFKVFRLNFFSSYFSVVKLICYSLLYWCCLLICCLFILFLYQGFHFMYVWLLVWLTILYSTRKFDTSPTQNYRLGILYNWVRINSSRPILTHLINGSIPSQLAYSI